MRSAVPKDRTEVSKLEPPKDKTETLPRPGPQTENAIDGWA